MKLPEIIGVAGANAAGKDTLAIVRARFGKNRNVSLSNAIRVELTAQGIEHERENMRGLADEWRREFGAGVLAVKSIEQYRELQQAEGYDTLTLTSVRHPDEAVAIQENGGAMIWIDADLKIRYARAQARLVAEGRPSDRKTLDQFIAEEEAEMHRQPGAGLETLSMADVRDVADIVVNNNFATKPEFEQFLIAHFEIDAKNLAQ